MKPYYQYSKTERLALEGQDLQDSIKLEAIDRGIKLPLELESALQMFQFKGYHHPVDAVGLYELCIPERYGSGFKGTGLAFRTEEEAKNALKGAIILKEEGYPAKLKVCDQAPGYKTTYVSLSTPPPSFNKKLEEYKQDDSTFHALQEEIWNNYQSLRQEAYNEEVRQIKRKEYLLLAQGDTEIAKRFWAKTEGTEWPTDQGVTIAERNGTPEKIEAEDRAAEDDEAKQAADADEFNARPENQPS